MRKSTQLLLAGALFNLSAVAIAETPPTEPATTATYKDSQLHWAPCPEFIPKGCEIAVLHGNPSKENLDVFFKVPPGFTIPSHWHTSPERMVLVSGTLVVTYAGQKPMTMHVGTYAYGPAAVPHKAVCSAGAPCVLFIAFVAPLDAMLTAAASK